MLRALFFRSIMFTLAVMGGIFFADGNLAIAGSLWLVGGAIFFFCFPLIEGKPVLRLNRLFAIVIPVLCFIAISALSLFFGHTNPVFSLILLIFSILFYIAVAWLLVKIRG